MEKNISRITNYINKERNNRQEEMTETVKIKRHRQAKSPLEEIYNPKLDRSITDFYKALEDFMRDVDEEDDQENDAF